MNERNYVLRQTLWFGLGILAGTILMVLVFLAIGRFDLSVLIGAVVGTLVSVGNFFFMSVSLTNASNSETDPGAAANKAKGGYILRMLIVGAILVLGIKSGYCNVFATLIPLLFGRPVLMLEEFFLKNGDKK